MYVLAPRAVASLGVAALACGYALVRGRGPERLGATAYGAAWMLTPAVQLHPLARVQLGVMALDAAAAGVFLGLALTGDRWWPLAAAALSLLVLVEHFGYALAPHGLALAYFAGEAIWSYALLAILVAGTALEASPGRPLTAAKSAD